MLCSAPGNLGIRPGTRVSQLLNIAFDMCVWEVLGCFVNGGTLILRNSSRTRNTSRMGETSLIPHTVKMDGPSEWVTMLKTVDVMIATPSILARLDPRELNNIRTVAVAGEPCSQRLADDWAEGRTFYNCCGPTEVRRDAFTVCI